MLRCGLVSVTFRNLDINGIVLAAKNAGLDGIEWGGDVHVPCGDTEKAAYAKQICDRNSLKIYSYGSYYRCGLKQSFKPVLDTAVILGTQNIRVWAGSKNSGDTAPDERAEIVADMRNICDDAQQHDITISFEWHNGTLTDTPESAITLISEIDRPNAKLYWQPNQFKSFEFNVNSLTAVLPYISNVHVFSWQGNKKFPLEHTWCDWCEYIRILKSANGFHGLFMEFVPNGTEDELIRDTATLKEIITSDIPQVIGKFGLEIPRGGNQSYLARKVEIKDTGVILKNSITTHPMEGFDANIDGSPSELSEKRYLRFANSGASLVWFEAIAVQPDARTSSRQMMITNDNLDTYKRLIEKMHETSDGVPVIAQLTHSGRFSAPNGTPAPIIAYHNPVLNQTFNIPSDYPVVTDDYLDRLEQRFIDSARLAYSAGFDGVDIKACHRYLLSELLSAYLRDGKYGGCYENRTRLFKNIIKNIADEFSDNKKFIIASRFGLYDAIQYPYGFACGSDITKPELAETKKLVGEMYDLGVRVINITMGTPYFNPHINRPYASGGYLPPEHPLSGVERLIKYTGEMQNEFPNMTVIGTGYSYLGKNAPDIAAAVLENGLASAVGFGRMAFAYEFFARDMLNGSFDERKVCITCGKCTEIMRAHGTTGCPVRNAELYAPIYRQYCTKKD